MRLQTAFIGMAMVSLSACATVDLGEMTTSEPAVAAFENTPINVVQRTSKKLTEVFTQNGWSKAPDPMRIQKAANMLLRGMGKDKPIVDTSYAAKAVSVETVRADILLASQTVTQTVKAAEVYMSVADTDTRMRGELKSLEKALAACARAETMFVRALENLDAADIDGDMAALRVSVGELRKVTNLYGDRVRGGKPLIGAAAS